jgi:predicted RNase H-like HicB family nuclease
MYEGYKMYKIVNIKIDNAITRLHYWKDDKWYVGRLVETPGVISQGKTVKSLIANIKDAYNVMHK